MIYGMEGGGMSCRWCFEWADIRRFDVEDGVSGSELVCHGMNAFFFGV